MPILEASPFDFLNKRFIMAVFGCAFGSGFQHGYHLGIVNIGEEVIQSWMSKLLLERTKIIPTDSYITLLWSVVVSIFSVGAFIGGLLTYMVAEKIGRRGGLIMNNVILFVATIFMSLAHLFKTYEILIIGRFLVGINVGLNAGLAPIYLVEISPDCIRGSVATIYQLLITIGILLANIFGMRPCFGNDNEWPYMFIVPLVPAVIQIFILIMCPESPKHLYITKGDLLGADKALVFLRQSQQIDEELSKLEKENDLQRPEIHIANFCSDHRLRHPLIICLFVTISQQLCGIDSITSYSIVTLRELGFLRMNPYFAVLGFSILYVLTTIASVLLMDIAGRRPLLLFGFVGMTALLFIMSLILLFLTEEGVLIYIYSIFTLFYIIAFAVGVGPIPWFTTAELFPHKARALAASVTVPINFFFDFLVAQTYLLLIDFMAHYGTFLFFIFNFIAIFLVLFFMPETKRYTAADIIEYFK